MAKYAILIYEDPAYYANLSPEAWGAVVDAHSTFVEQVFELGGSLAGGEALAPPTTATTIKGGGTVTDGPFVETKEALQRLLRRRGARPRPRRRDRQAVPGPAPGGGVEVRPVVDPTTNPF